MMDDCWEYEGPVFKRGYGMRSFRVEGKTKTVQVHRFAYEVIVGPIPEGLELGHLCHNPPCYNPCHLKPMTHTENEAMKTRPTACPQGHAYDEANTYHHGGQRFCRACNRDSHRRAA